MEMVEETQNQPQFSLKRIKFEEMFDNEEEDRISLLPDCLIVEILSSLPSIEYAIRTSTLSKRWKHLWTFVPNLIFHNRGWRTIENHRRSGFLSFVDKTLTQCRQRKLNIFEVELYSSYEVHFESQVCNWIRYAINCNVEKLNLMLMNRDLEAEFELDPFVFINSCFTHLHLKGCIFNPTGAISWEKLTSLTVSHGNLDEDMIENILSGSPLLETLTLTHCYGYKQINITSESVKNLVFYGYTIPRDGLLQSDDFSDVIEIKAPNILSLTIKGGLMLWKILLLNVSSLVKVDLDYKRDGYYETTRKETEEEMLKGFILNLRHVKELKIGICCFKALFRLEAKGFIFPSNLKVVNVTSSLCYHNESSDCSDCDCDSGESGDLEVDDGPNGNEAD